MKKIALSLMMMVCFPFATAMAVNVKDLYQAEIPVVSQTGDAKEQAVRDAFIQVLVKVSGNPQVADNKVIKANLGRADYYVQDYSYSNETASDAQYLLQIRFEPTDLKRLLQKAGVGYWGENRPLVLVWLVVTDAHQEMTVVGKETETDVYADMMQAGNRYGLPIIFPMLDVYEVNDILPRDIINASMSILEPASRRYMPDALLIGEIDESDQVSKSKWKLISKDKQWEWAIDEKATPTVIAMTVDRLNAALSGKSQTRTDPIASNELNLKIQVDNVENKHMLARLMAQIKRLRSVQHLELVEVDGDIVDLTVHVHGNFNDFQRDLLASRRLVFKSKDVDNDKLLYDWVQ